MLSRLGFIFNNLNANYKSPLLLTVVVSSIFIAGCASRSDTAPITDYTNSNKTAAAIVTSSGATYVVKPGDTLYSIARSNNIQVPELARLNNINDATQLSVGQVLRINDGSPIVATTGMTSPIQDDKSQALSPSDSSSESKPESSDAQKTTSVAPAADANTIDWAWPINGNIIQGFNASTKGIDIEGAIGDPVKAAASGKIIYAGNGVRGLGNLLLVSHEDGFISAYAHNHELIAKKDQTVKKGDKIATVGQSDTNSPRLHFEIRRRGTPVNPISYLPKL